MVYEGGVEPFQSFVGALLKLVDLRARGLRVYVHCRTGCGRSGSLIASYLVLVEGYSAGDAIDLFRLKRGCGPESWEQYEFVYALDNLVSRVGRSAAISVLRSCRSIEEFLGRVRSVSL